MQIDLKQICVRPASESEEPRYRELMAQHRRKNAQPEPQHPNGLDYLRMTKNSSRVPAAAPS